jgi:CheY-like chemotaxis protein
MRALVADDDEGVRRYVTTVLHGAGHDVVAVGDGTRAADRLGRDAFDVAVLDHHMPGLTGLEVARDLRDATDPGVVVMSARSVEALLRGSDGLSHVVFLPKPFGQQALLDAVGQATSGGGVGPS